MGTRSRDKRHSRPIDRVVASPVGRELYDKLLAGHQGPSTFYVSQQKKEQAEKMRVRAGYR